MNKGLIVVLCVVMVALLIMVFLYHQAVSDRDYYMKKYNNLLETKDMVVAVKYSYKDDKSIQAQWSSLGVGETQEITFTDNPYYKVVGIALYRNMKPLPNLPIEKSTPWSALTIQDKMFLCAYGSSGNKLNKQDLKELTERYGVK